MFSAPINAMVRATSASMYSACGLNMPVTANARVKLCPMVKPVTTKTRSRSRREISTNPRRNDMWSTPVKMCIIPMRMNSKKLAFLRRPPGPPVTSIVWCSFVMSCSVNSPVAAFCTCAKLVWLETRSKKAPEWICRFEAESHLKVKSNLLKPASADKISTGGTSAHRLPSATA